MTTKTQAISSFLNAMTLPDLASLYSINMECQVNVAQDDGERIEGEFNGRKWIGYANSSGEQWKSFRIPFNAMTSPTYEDKPISFDLARHADGIGMTGWDWKNQVSKWVAYDFDAITGHSSSHSSKLSNDELKKVQEIATKIPWVTVRFSTSGKGLHLYVFLDDVPTQNHTEHAALARAILSMMSGLTGFNFGLKVDICGGNMWVWHRKMKGTNGLSIIRQGDILSEPPEWRGHLDVVRNTRRRVSTPLNEQGMPEIEEKFDSLAAQRNRIKLESEHLNLIKYLTENGLYHWWDADHHMLITHTMHLKKAHEELNYRGIFETDTKGSTTHNCFAFPLRRGGWSIRRYSPGVKEHPSWDQDGAGWTRCFYNIDPTLRSASVANNGLEDTNGAYQFRNSVGAEKAAQALGANILIPPAAGSRPTSLKQHKDGRLILELEAYPQDQPTDYEGWLRKGTKWIRMFSVPRAAPVELDVESYDEVIRHVITEGAVDGGWTVNGNGQWVDEPLQHVKPVLESMGLKSADIKAVIGGSVLKPWMLVTQPFKDEYPGDRIWNRYGPKFKFPPLISDTYVYPTWKRLFDHLGTNLNDGVRNNKWCSNNGIVTGSDYLKIWVASMFQYPTESLPYLFLYSEEQVTGKSTFHQALSLLFSPGYQFTDHAILNASSFNGELEGTILCVIEETDLSNTKTMAYNRIKQWVTSPRLSIHRKHMTPYLVINTTHFIQTANNRRYCVILPGDTRITMIKVNTLAEEIPERVLTRQLEKEASDFLGAIMSLELPEPPGRLRIPTIETEEKIAAQDSNLNALEVFIKEKVFDSPGKSISLTKFHDAFQMWLDPAERANWSIRKVSKLMPDRIIKARIPGGDWHWGNVSFTEFEGPATEVLVSKNEVFYTRTYDVSQVVGK